MHEGSAFLAVEDLVFDLAFRASAFDHESEGPRGTTGGMGDVGRDEEGLTLSDAVIHDPTVLPGLQHDVALQLDEELFAVDLVEIVASVGTPDHHREEVPSAVEVLVADRRLEVRPVSLGPGQQIQWITDASVEVEAIGLFRSAGITGGGCGGIGHGRALGSEGFESSDTSRVCGETPRIPADVRGIEYRRGNGR